jgi:hypothetical protein
MLKSGFTKLACPVVLAAMLAACGGSGSSDPSGAPPSAPPNGGNPVTPDPVVGVSMPNSVSVVTATNAS